MLNKIEKFIECARRTGVLVDDEVKSYLLKYHELIPAVKKAIRTAKEKLSASQLLLRVYHDFEIDEEALHLIVRFERYDEIVLRKIRDVRKDYWDLLPDDSGMFILMTDYRTPSK
ncbi:MAG: hypothetical protein HPY87_06330 [Fervidobacterium sp.]|uniref:hypothetical protein n=1 Tax=Fervidobacterium TaxID=2422 RepID=UPI001436C863|nr:MULTISPECIES: hypothetical protein [Fervidobacterium]NPU89496.1 hypothetical protein [Fervidobacterium sp.]QIV77647.1 hypothetical protein HER11_00590 [Fervidobacterium pennivorans subsp. keratinolyticus]